MANRLLLLTKRRNCPECDKIKQIQKQLDDIQAVAEEIERIGGGTDLFEFYVPGMARVLSARFSKAGGDSEGDDDDLELGKLGVRLMLGEIAECRLAELDEDLHAYAVAELRRISEALDVAACRIESAREEDVGGGGAV